MAAVGSLYGYGGVANDMPGHSPMDYMDLSPDTAGQAALSVAVMIVGAALFLAILKRSGFRAMVAVGRG
jgi:hypothetical protein